MTHHHSAARSRPAHSAATTSPCTPKSSQHSTDRSRPTWPTLRQHSSRQPPPPDQHPTNSPHHSTPPPSRSPPTAESLGSNASAATHVYGHGPTSDRHVAPLRHLRPRIRHSAPRPTRSSHSRHVRHQNTNNNAVRSRRRTRPPLRPRPLATPKAASHKPPYLDQTTSIHLTNGPRSPSPSDTSCAPDHPTERRRREAGLSNSNINAHSAQDGRTGIVAGYASRNRARKAGLGTKHSSGFPNHRCRCLATKRYTPSRTGRGTTRRPDAADHGRSR